MPKVTITITRDERGVYWARRLGKHVASKTHAEAKANAEKFVSQAGGPDKAEIRDLTGEDAPHV